MTSDDRNFAFAVSRQGFFWGSVIGAIGSWATWIAGDFLIWKYPGLFSRHHIHLWPLPFVAAPIDWIRLGMLLMLTTAATLAWHFWGPRLVEQAASEVTRRQSQALLRQICLERNPKRRAQLITLFELKFPEEAFIDATRN